MKTQISYILPIIFLTVISSCNKTEINSTFDENIKIKMIETVDSVKRTLSFNIYTEKIFACSNYLIDANYTLTNEKITINLVKIITPIICLTSLGSAATIINIKDLANKTYDLELNFGTQKINGQFDVTTGSYTATLPIQTKVQFVNPDLKRIPNNTIYGTVHYHSAYTSSIIQKFIDTIQLYGATQSLYPIGNYEQFQIEPNGQIKQTQDLGYYFTQYYIFNYSDNSEQLKNLVKRFGINYGDLLLITLNSSKGETFYSWTQ